MTIKKGFQFYHKHYRDEANNPMLFVVTKVARGAIYFRPLYGDGKSIYCASANFHKYVLGAAA